MKNTFRYLGLVGMLIKRDFCYPLFGNQEIRLTFSFDDSANYGVLAIQLLNKIYCESKHVLIKETDIEFLLTIPILLFIYAFTF